MDATDASATNGVRISSVLQDGRATGQSERSPGVLRDGRHRCVRHQWGANLERLTRRTRDRPIRTIARRPTRWTPPMRPLCKPRPCRFASVPLMGRSQSEVDVAERGR